MKINLVGHSESGKTCLENKLTKLYPEHQFKEVKDNDEIENSCDGVIVLVNLMDGPMPGTRLGIEKCKRAKVRIAAFCFTHLDEFDAHTQYSQYFKELVEIEARELASTYGFDDDAIPSTRIALVDNSEESIKNFVGNMLQYLA